MKTYPKRIEHGGHPYVLATLTPPQVGDLLCFLVGSFFEVEASVTADTNIADDILPGLSEGCALYRPV